MDKPVYNPYEIIYSRLSNIESLLLDIKHKSPTQIQEESDRCTKEEARKFLKREGIEISESQLYKLTATKKIPCKHFGNRLVFSRKDLLAWVESQTVDASATSNATLTLAKSARRKQKKG